MKITLRALVQKSTLMATAFILAVSTLTAAVPFVLSQNVSAAPAGGAKNVYTSLSGSGWSFYNDVSPLLPTAGSIAIDPAYTAGAENNGAVRINASHGQKQNLRTSLVSGTKLSEITAIGYDTYITHVGSSYINIDVNFGDSSYENYNGRLVYVPAATVNSWHHTENAVEGLWTWSQYGDNGNKWIDGETDKNRTWSDIVSAFPSAKVGTLNYLNLFGASIPLPSTGYIHLRADQSDTYFDNVYVQKNNAPYTIYDFELPDLQTPANLRLNGSFTCGYATNVNSITPTWDAVAGAVSYDYKVELPNGSVHGPRNLGNVTSISGEFGAEGTSKFSVRAVAANGLTSDWAPLCAVSYDKSAPTVSNISIDRTINGNTGGKVVVTFDLADVAGVDLSKSYVLFADGPNTTTRHKESAKYTPTLVSGSTYSVTIDTLQFVKANWMGTYNLQFTLYDVLGNHTSTKPVSILIDNDGPRAVLTAPSSGSYVREITKFTYDVTDATGVQSGWMAFMQNGTEVERFTFAKESEGKWYANVDTTLLDSGSYVIDTRFVDLLGKATYGANKGTVVVDNDGPVTAISNATVLGDTITIEGIVSDSTNLRYYYCWLTTNQTITVDGHTFTPGQEVKLSNNADSTRNAACNTTWANGQNDFSGVLGGFNIPNVPDGSYTVNLVAYDLAGNNNAANPATYTFTLDRTAPEVAITSLTTDRIEGTADLDATIVLTIDGVDTAPFAPEADGTWGYDFLPVLGEGAHNIIVTVSDILGNERFATASLTVLPVLDDEDEPETIVQIDSTPQAPTLPSAVGPAAIADVQGDSTTNNGEPAIEGASTEKTPAQAVDLGGSDGTVLGIAWYWWLAIIAALAAAAWWIVGALRRRQAE